jgi:pimeloyl-ACP methyl ester carboxylesterase
MTHSQAGEFGWILADSRPKQVKAIVALEPFGPPFINAIFPPFTSARIYGLTDIPVAYHPPITSASDIARVVVGSVSPTSSSLYELTSLFFNSEIPGVTCFQQPKPARKLINLVNIPVLTVTSESSYHAQYDNCSVEYLRNAGVSVEHVSLGDVGIHGRRSELNFYFFAADGALGNGHLFFMEKNGLQIADQVIRPWISKIRH